MIFVSARLGLPRAGSASLLTINSAAILVASILGGPVVDRFGRKWVMVIGLLLNGLVYVFYSQADTYVYFAALMILSGVVNPLYRIGSDAMLADLVPPEKRIDAYALIRLSHNLGIALGPTIGGFLAAASYNTAFYFAASGMVIYSLLLLFLARETLPKPSQSVPMRRIENPITSYRPILRDRGFLRFLGVFTLVQACAVLIWILLPVHAKEVYHVTERVYGFIPTTNALMVVTLQVLVTTVTRRFLPMPVMAVGALFYAFANGGVALSSGFWGFWACMVVMTLGELIIMPTSSTYVANLAPADMRGRYMSLYGLSWGVASGIAPVLGGLLNDVISPQATWIGGMGIGLIATFSFMLLSRQIGKQAQSIQPSSSDQVVKI